MKRIRLLFCLTITLLLCCASCTNNFVEVKVLTPRGEAVDFSKYDHFFYAPCTITGAPQTVNTEKELNVFFLEDVPRIIEKEVTAVTVVEKIDPAINGLLFTGNLIFEIKERKKIEEVKAADGKKEKRFSGVQHWELTLEVVIKETATGKELFTKKYAEKLMEADLSDARFNFENIFFKISNRFAREITTIKKMQRRYLIIR